MKKIAFIFVALFGILLSVLPFEIFVDIVGGSIELVDITEVLEIEEEKEVKSIPKLSYPESLNLVTPEKLAPTPFTYQTLEKPSPQTPPPRMT